MFFIRVDSRAFVIVVKALSHQFSRAVHLERRAVEVVIYPALRQPLHIIPPG